MNRLHLQARHLCLLALLQLAVGPLVLVQVSMFCSLTVREIPRHNVAAAMVKAWHNDQFQSLLDASSEVRADASRTSQPNASTKAKPCLTKTVMIAWQSLPTLPATPAEVASWGTHAEVWTPAWVAAPPGPPPRAC